MPPASDRLVVDRQRAVVVLGEAPFVAAARLEGRLVAPGPRRVAHGGRRRALIGSLVPPDGATLALRFDFLGMLGEVMAHELGDVGLVHGYRFSRGTQGRSSGPV